VEAAEEGLGTAIALGTDHLVAAVLADVVEGAHPPVRGAYQKDRLSEQRHFLHEKVAGLG
jgi:hypothetical protein